MPRRTYDELMRHYLRCEDCSNRFPKWQREDSPTTGGPLCPDCAAERGAA